MILLKTNKNESWQFFHEPGRGICQRRGTHIPQILFPDGCADFDANCDDRGQIHLVTESRTHDLTYFAHDGKNWQQLTLLKSRGTARMRHFRLMPVNRWQNLFYTLFHEGRELLVHQIIDAPAKPEVIDAVSGDFVCALTDHDTIGLFYKKEEGTLCFREYLWSQKQWSETKTVAPDGEIADCLYVPGDGFHFLTLKEGRITHLAAEQTVIEEETDLMPALHFTDNVLWVAWVRMGQIRACRSEDFGLHFDPPTRFLSQSRPETFYIRPTRFLHTVCNRAFGSVVNGVSSLSIIGKRFSEPFLPPPEVKRLGQEVEEFADPASLQAEIARLRAENEALKKTSPRP